MSLAAAHAVDPRALWDLDYSRLNVNHGSFGAAPRSVLAEQARWRARMEAGTTYFMVDEAPAALRAAAGELGAFLGATGKDIAFVDNVTAGVNAVLRSMTFAPGDEILVHSHGYGAVIKTAAYVAALSGAVVTSAALPFPDPTNEGIVAAFRAAITPRTRVVVLDHITSASALTLPVAELVALCREAGVLSLVDGSHAPANVPLDIEALGADIYVGNCHKWLMAPKGAGFLWAKPEHQGWLHPTIISHGYGEGFLAEFDWTGTRDWSAALSVPSAIAFHHGMGGPALMAANHSLAWQAADLLASAWKTSIPASADYFSAMSLIEAPLAGPATEERVLQLRKKLRALGADAPVVVVDGRLFVRVSAQAYNRIDDYERLADIVLQVAEED